ncbi:winged helix-turn-helix transcriptional regulator [Actinomadura darangshiensis]|uniref:winged helix-turn-helix transcriptional regulator n=1 Tax=Actinomadura darangshiensis TaxID=705336 RepID=UPI00140C84B1|nr:helix-turn-helix domain-containing protein [Actinomadura darangshiensis]
MTDWTDKSLVSETQTVLEIVSGKWTLHVLAALVDGPRRHNDLRRHLGDGIRPKVFDETLRRLTALELIERHATRKQDLPAVYYGLTPLARDLMSQMTVVADWTDQNRPTIKPWRDRGR